MESSVESRRSANSSVTSRCSVADRFARVDFANGDGLLQQYAAAVGFRIALDAGDALADGAGQEFDHVGFKIADRAAGVASAHRAVAINGAGQFAARVSQRRYDDGRRIRRTFVLASTLP